MKTFKEYVNESINENVQGGPRGIDIIQALENEGLIHDFRFTQFFYSGYNEKYRTHVYTVVDKDDEYWLATTAYVYIGRNGNQTAEFAPMPIESEVDLQTALNIARQHARTAASKMKKR